MSEEGFENLRIAILKRAVDDYIDALTVDNPKKAASIETFFLSEWGEFLSGGHGDFLITECRKRANVKGEKNNG